MKKDLIFAPILFALGAVLGLLRFTGITAHIVVSIVGALVLVAYTVLTKKDWEIVPLEIVARVFYGIALISGIVIMNVSVVVIVIVHKLSSVLFLATLLALLSSKIIMSKKS